MKIPFGINPFSRNKICKSLLKSYFVSIFPFRKIWDFALAALFLSALEDSPGDAGSAAPGSASMSSIISTFVPKIIRGHTVCKSL